MTNIRITQKTPINKPQNKKEIQNYQNERVIDPKKLSDNELYEKCQLYGENAKIWLRRFAGLLPEVHSRELYRKKGFLSIYEFAKKLAGMSEFTVSRILNLSARLEDKPYLRMQFELGEQGWSKIEKVANIATFQTDKEWSKKVSKMSSQTLSEYIRHYKNNCESNVFAGESADKTTILSHEFTFLSFKVSQNVEHKLRVYKQKLEKQQKMNLSWNEVFDELVKTPNNSISPINNNRSTNTNFPKPPSRHIPAATRCTIQKKYKNKCAFPGCNKPYTQLHHKKRFSIFKEHNPEDIIPLCNTHHALVHTGLIKNEHDPPEKWIVKEKEGNKTLSDLVDQKILKFRKSL